jgi:maltose alpha-D-glucosyltransferase/alpha-amylase
MSNKEFLFQYWKALYPAESYDRLEAFIDEIDGLIKSDNSISHDWYKDAVVYSLYVDLYNKDFKGLTAKLDYLQGLGVSCLWLLPILDSPMRDAGFDIRNFDLIRHDLLGLKPGFSKQEQEKVFGEFLLEAKNRGIRVIFDVAINHCSEEHPWFVEAKKSEDSPYRDYFIWTRDTTLYKDARIIFKGMETSNWEAWGDWYYFHRFFNFQPDLNYRNPDVLLAMSRNLLYWQSMGVDGFRADAIPYLWKAQGTICENLPQTHTIVKFFRAVLDYVKPGTLLLAEACQQPATVVEYMGNGDECHAAYHFPLMPQMYKAIAMQKAEPVKKTLSLAVTPKIPEGSQWFTFLRCHDELSLELVYVTENDRKYIHENYCHEPEWDFRLGEGISARLANLMKFDHRKIGLAYSMMLSLPGTPVIYYGDEFGKENDQQYYKEMAEMVGKDDTRFLVRGKINWELRLQQLNDPSSFQSKVFNRLQQMLHIRNQHKAFGRGSIEFLEFEDDGGNPTPHLLAFARKFEDEHLLIVHNLSDKQTLVDLPRAYASSGNLFTAESLAGNQLSLEAFEYLWLTVNPQNKTIYSACAWLNTQKVQRTI